ncbi:hypothetical protein AMAG_19824 [Allomyces macrogynus ATCC 38327]|uniref:Uncharacterized protein n=1 Tax=Allomyces macrogynus (strain ATCC 38327) TaxID=578462 RepID=A0A0L0T083_ALLM3|nr:hypothetical protein AMAG_19824 [Allomyces macrogynus ATCC 38327]|eukprot:KNE67984.1 hypothetical protein AMAG_19824 [Allomyces macrogynus ATCC 38327]
MMVQAHVQHGADVDGSLRHISAFAKWILSAPRRGNNGGATMRLDEGQAENAHLEESAEMNDHDVENGDGSADGLRHTFHIFASAQLLEGTGFQQLLEQAFGLIEDVQATAVEVGGV